MSWDCGVSLGTSGAAPDLQQADRSAREADSMDRRRFLTGAAGVAAATAGLASPAISQRITARTLRFVPQADLANFDPIWTTTFVVRNASALVWDTLHGVDDKLQPRRQMVEAEEMSTDGHTRAFRLRPGDDDGAGWAAPLAHIAGPTRRGRCASSSLPRPTARNGELRNIARSTARHFWRDVI
jgi:hypothetical protein